MKALGILLCVLASTLPGAAEDVSTLIVVGEGKVLVPADVVYVSISATSQDDNLTQAWSNCSEVLNGTIEALIDAGVGRDDFQAGRGRSVSSIQTMSRVCNNSSCVMVADESVTLVKEQITIRFDPTDEYLINRTFELADAEGAESEISGYALEDRSAAFAEARESAVQDAENDAEALASAAGLKLGTRLEIIERSDPIVRQPHSCHDPMEFSMVDFFDVFWFEHYDPFERTLYAEPGMMEVRSRVIVTYEVTS
jgi:uncharacterized protein YggE